ncbi:hypothetical protein [Legionella waltersii]|uniref:Uncharacterized protein n=1 Tax=Legionella waltersii TaxID=66969 RepID=A0A0W1AAW2_9GAMM|nr:hypothetical protein [Legionella waltersii]KTD78477.1 hypothetical protein Lwal_1912 [Legionella waltersii]SNV05853.1 Uncharacterised protein [Legionella waltersii]
MKEKRINQSESIINKPSDIPEGLVAKRKAELLRTKQEESLTLQNSIHNQEHQQNTGEHESVNPQLVHPTRERSQIKHRPPSSFHSSSSPKTLFPMSKEIIHKEPATSINSGLIKTEDEPPSSLWTDLINALTKAVDNYTKGKKEGTTPSEEYGWFSWLRHGEKGGSKANELRGEARDTTNVDALLTVLHLFFLDSSTRFNNHSLAPYVVDELNNLLVNYALKPFLLKLGAQYDINSWLYIKKQLNQLELSQDNQENQTLRSLR